MQKRLSTAFVVCAVTALFAGGCAKHDIVKKDETIPSVAPSASAGQATSATKAAQAQPESKNQVAAAPVVEAPAKQAANAQAAELKASLDKVFFDFDSYALSPKARETLSKNAENLKKDGRKVRIEGNCDELGSDDYNLALGEKRANAAQKYLLSLGISPARISTISYGKEKPVDRAHTEAARAANRRDEFVYLAQ